MGRIFSLSDILGGDAADVWYRAGYEKQYPAG